MAAAAEKLEQQPVPVNERVLTEVDHLAAHRLEDGSYPDAVLNDVLSNLKTAVQEGGVPHAVSTTRHEYIPTGERRGVFMWMGKTAVANAMSGYRFHIDEAARERVAVEVDEAHHAQEDMRPGVMKVFISPRMSEKDASREVAEREHLAYDDAVRVSWLETDENGVIQHRMLQSLLVKDIPLEAWVAMLRDPDNIFNKSVDVKDTESALSVMRVHRELEVLETMLKNGVVDIVRAVLPYITDKKMYANVARQIEKFESDQVELDRQAEYIAEQWLGFETELDQSFYRGQATFEIERFIVGLQTEWKEEDIRVINNHLVDGKYLMTRQLAVIIEKAKQNALWTTAAVMAGNEAVLKQIDPLAKQQIAHNAQLIYSARETGLDVRMLEAENNRLIASQQVRVGGGCAGDNSAFGKNGKPGTQTDLATNSESSTKLEWKPGVCRIEVCPTRPGVTEVAQCSICRGCQAMFDSGLDPSKQNKAARSDEPVGFDTDKLFKDMYAFLKKNDAKKPDLQPA